MTPITYSSAISNTCKVMARRQTTYALALMFLLGANTFATPTWSLIDSSSSGSTQYFKYSSSAPVEEDPTSNSSHVPGISYGFQSGTHGSGLRSVCAYANNPSANVYWYNDSTGASMVGSYPLAPPSEFNVSEPNYWEGFEVKGAVYGSLSSNPSAGQQAVAVSYYTDDACTDAGSEFGFVTELVNGGQATFFYYSIRNNCASNTQPPGAACRSASHWGASDPGENDPQNQDNGTNGPTFTGLSAGTTYTYSVYIASRSGATWNGSCWSAYDFAIEIDDANGSPVYGPTRTPINTLQNGGTFPACTVLGEQGYIITGTEMTTPSGILNTPAHFDVADVWGGL